MATKKTAAGTKHRQAFGRRIRELRLERDHSQEKLAELSGLHRNYVGGVERGEINLSLENIHALAHGLRVDVAELFVDGKKKLSAARATRKS